MEEIIVVNGLKTRIWTYDQKWGYGCAECCNGDRCDEECTARYRRPNCPHCKGKGWVDPMNITSIEKPQQMGKESKKLPAETFTRGDYVQPEGETAIVLVTGWTNTESNFRGVVVDTPIDAQFPLRLGEYSETWHTKKFKKVYYATKLHQANEVIKVLKYDNNKLKGQVEGLQDAVDELKKENDGLARWKQEAKALLDPIWDYAEQHINVPLGKSKTEAVINHVNEAKELLNEVLVMNEAWGDLPGEFINKVKTFLYGE